MALAGSKRAYSDDDDAPGDARVASPTVSKLSRPDFANEALPAYRCTLPPRCNTQPTVVSTLTELESHYRSVHQFSCIAPKCGKIFPDDRFLSLHITEMHDPIALVKQDRGQPILACFEPTCKRKFSTPKKRRLHLIDFHKYPKEFYFALPKRGLNDLFDRFGAGVSLVGPGWRSRAAKTTTGSDEDGDALSPDDDPLLLSSGDSDDEDVDQLVDQLQDARLVPPRVRFGRKGGGIMLGSGAGPPKAPKIS